MKKFLIPMAGVAGCMVALLWIMAGPALLFSSQNGLKNDHPIVIAVVKEMEIQQYELAVEGFRDILGKEKITAELEMIDLNDRYVTARIRELKPGLILTLGSAATNSIADEIKEIPIIYSMVIDPRGSGVAARKIVGAVVDIPVKKQLEILKSVTPSLKRIGVVYNPAENEILVQEARAAALELGFTLNAYPVNSETEIPDIGKLPIDLLWIIPDTMVSKSVIVTRFLQAGIKNKIAVMGFTRSYAGSGALLAISCDYKDIGRQSGELAVRVLKGEDYSKLVTTLPRVIKLYLNSITAGILGISFPESTIEKASEVF